jgi:hypothetical protein
MAYEKIGGLAFLIGVAIAVIAGFASAPITEATAEAAGYVTLAVVVLGLIVGLINIGSNQTGGFLMAAIAVVLIGTANLSVIPVIGDFLHNMVLNVVAFVAPAGLVVGLKAIYVYAFAPGGISVLRSGKKQKK